MYTPPSQTFQIPYPALYHTHNYSSDSNWLAYQVSINQIRLLCFDQNLNISENIPFTFNPQPIKQIKVIFDKKQNQVYLGIVFLTKFEIYRKQQQICSHRLKLDRNIVLFQNTFVSCDAKCDSDQVYFTFLTKTGQIHIVPVDKIDKRVTINVPLLDEKLCQIKITQNSVVVIGTEQGRILLIDLNANKITQRFDTKSLMPILHMEILKSRIIVSTCQGQLFNLSQNLSSMTSVSAHQGLIMHLFTDGKRLYTYGEDCNLNVFEIDNQIKQLKLVRNQEYKKRVNLLFSCNNNTFLNCYEEITLENVSY